MLNQMETGRGLYSSLSRYLLSCSRGIYIYVYIYIYIYDRPGGQAVRAVWGSGHGVGWGGAGMGWDGWNIGWGRACKTCLVGTNMLHIRFGWQYDATNHNWLQQVHVTTHMLHMHFSKPQTHRK